MNEQGGESGRVVGPDRGGDEGPGGGGSPVPLFSEAEWRRLAGALDLTKRQAEVAQLIATGHTYEGMALRLGISVNTVRMHVRGLFQAVDTHDRLGAMLRLVETHRQLQGETRPPQSH